MPNLFLNRRPTEVRTHAHRQKKSQKIKKDMPISQRDGRYLIPTFLKKKKKGPWRITKYGCTGAK